MRAIKMFDLGRKFVERLEMLVSDSIITYAIINESPLPFVRYHSVIRFSNRDGDCHISWSSNWRSKGDPLEEVRDIAVGFYRSIFEGVVGAG